ncbi:MAG: 30S ribosomal protein S6 [Actinobacteria bacterium]|nr:30S ribosomal protein S6 [Actinomycetota bacterium]
MRPYEVMIILDVTLEESAMQAVLNRSTELIESMGGQVGRVDKWGRRRFAYPIAHRTEGYYVVVDFSAETPLVDELGRSLRLADEVVRHKIVRLPDTTVKKAVLVATGPDDE